MIKRVIVTIGPYGRSFAVDASDAAALLDVAMRAISVEHLSGSVFTQCATQLPLVESMQISDYEPLALPAEERPF